MNQTSKLYTRPILTLVLDKYSSSCSQLREHVLTYQRFYVKMSPSFSRRNLQGPKLVPTNDISGE